MILKEVLEALIPSIQKIDGGCAYCIDEFIAEANKSLAEIDCPYKYVFIDNDVVRVVERTE
jgi:hypothetical protein